MPQIIQSEYNNNRGRLTILTPSEMLEVMPQHQRKERGVPVCDEWYGSNTSAECYRKALYGSQEYVEEVNRVMDQVSNAVNVETSAYEIDNAVVGFLPDVPSAIQNLPESMVMPIATQTDFAPITVFANPTMSAGVGNHAIMKRGAVICALILKLQAIRPVNLKVIVTGDGRKIPGNNHYIIVPVETRPLDVAQLSFMLCNPGWARHTYEYLSNVGGSTGAWDSLFKRHHSNAYSPEFHKDAIGFMQGDVEHDIYIPGLFLQDRLLKEPLKWIEETLARYAVADR